MRLLVTRPEPDATRTAERLRERGHHVIVAPLLRVAEIGNVPLGEGPFAGLVLTSTNAIRALEGHPRRPELLALPVFTVGHRTAAAARAAGFADVMSADGNAAGLIRLLMMRLSAGATLLYVAGEDRAADLAGALSDVGIAVHTVVVYRADMVAQLPETARIALAQGMLDGVLHFSRRSALAWLALVQPAGVTEPSGALTHFCLSGSIAGALTQAGAMHVRIAVRPDENALLDLIGEA